MTRQAGRNGTMKRYSTWIPFQRECVWCGEDFVFYSHMGKDGKAKRPIRFCSKRCIAEARWEGKKKCPPIKILSDLYVLKSLSVPAIAKQFNCSHVIIGRALRSAGIAMRDHTSLKACKICGQPVEKRFHWRRDKDGCRILSGALCLLHRREYYARKAREYERKRDPLIGTRKRGVPAILTQCPKCLKWCEGTRLAVNCCNQGWYKVKAFREAAKNVSDDKLLHHSA